MAERKEQTKEFGNFGEAVAYILQHWAGLSYVGRDPGNRRMGDLLVWADAFGGEPRDIRICGGSWVWQGETISGRGVLALAWWVPIQAHVPEVLSKYMPAGVSNNVLQGLVALHKRVRWYEGVLNGHVGWRVQLDIRAGEMDVTVRKDDDVQELFLRCYRALRSDGDGDISLSVGVFGTASGLECVEDVEVRHEELEAKAGQLVEILDGCAQRAIEKARVAGLLSALQSGILKGRASSISS